MFTLLIISLILLAHFNLLFLVQFPIDYYFLGSVYLCSLTYIRLQALELKERPLSESWRSWGSEALFFTLALSFGLLFYDQRSVWLDEYTQAQYAGEFWKCLSCGAALEQQPPLSYALTAVSLNLFGDTVYAIRLPSLIFLAGSVAVFWRLLGFALESKYLRLLGMILYIFNAHIFYYMTEARPYALFLCLGLMFIESVYRYWQSAQAREAYKMSALAGLTLMSIGLQAEVLVGAPLLIFLMTGQHHRLRTIFLMQVFSGLLFLPLLILITLKSFELQQFNSDYPGGYLLHLFDTGKNYLQGAIHSYRHFYPDLLLAGAGLFMALTHKNKSAQFWAALLTSFSLIFIFTFATFINWNLLYKYFIIIIPMMIVCLLIGFETLVKFLIDHLGGRLLRPLKYMIALLFCYKIFSYLLLFESRARPFADTAAIRWREVYAELTPELMVEDRVYTLGLNQLGEWGLARAIGVEFYAGKKFWQFLSSPTRRSVLSFEFDEERSGSVFLIMPRTWSSDTLYASSEVFASSDVVLRHFGGERVVELVDNGQTRHERLVAFFESIASRYGNQPWALNVWASLAKLYEVAARGDDQLRALNQIVALPPPVGASVTGSSLNYQKLLGGFLFEVSPSFVPPFAKQAKEDEKED